MTTVVFAIEFAFSAACPPISACSEKNTFAVFAQYYLFLAVPGL